MTMQIEATYENGLLRPLAPLPLPEHAHVTLTIETADDSGAQPKPGEWARRVRALAAMAPKVSHTIDDSRESLYD